MQRLMRKTIKPTTKYKAAVAAMNELGFDDLVAKATKVYGHSPYAFARIGLYLKYNEQMVSRIKKKGVDIFVDQVKGMTVDGIVEHLAKGSKNSPGVEIHRNSWIRWATPKHKYQSNNMYYKTWVLVRDLLNELLAKTNRSIQDFTNGPTYSPENLTALREATGLSTNEFAEIIGVANGSVIEELESTDVSVNKRGMGYDDWSMVLDRVHTALKLKSDLKHDNHDLAMAN